MFWLGLITAFIGALRLVQPVSLSQLLLWALSQSVKHFHKPPVGSGWTKAKNFLTITHTVRASLSFKDNTFLKQM